MKKSISELTSQHSQCDYDPNSLPVNQAKDIILQYLKPLIEIEELNLQAALGRVMAEDLHSPHNVPNHDNSAMDGYAFNAQSLQESSDVTLKVIGTAFAGKPYLGNKIEMGECVRIMTGAVIPLGADTVIAQERVTVSEKTIHFSEKLTQGTNVRYAGEDLKQGQVVLSQGHLIRPADLGLIASLGLAKIKVYRRLKVAFFSTGDELVGVGKPLEEGQLYDSNRYTIFGMLQRMGVETLGLGAIPDQADLLEQTLLKAAQSADVVITSGGVSVGEADYMKLLLQKHGEVVFWKIAMKPGRPLAYGKIGNAHYFGLPGNPVAVMVTFYQFVRDAMLYLMGQKSPKPLPLLKAICTEKIRKLAGRTEFQRGILFLDDDHQWKVKPTGNQSSGVLSSMSAANCFIVLETDTGNIDAGQEVKVQILEGLI